VINTAEIIQIAGRHYQAGRIEQARDLCRQVLQVNSHHAVALNLSGVIAHQQGKGGEAVELITKAIESAPEIHYFHDTLGVVLNGLGRFEEAIEAFVRAVSLCPDYAQAYYNMGNSLSSLSRYEEAIEQYEHALALKPNDACTYYNIAVVLQELDRHIEAVEYFNRSISLGHNDTSVSTAKAVSEQILGRHSDAIDTLKQALCVKPDCPDAHADLGMVLLTTGNFNQGWNEYQWRLKSYLWNDKIPEKLRWDGSNFKNKRLFVHSEQGFGDCIQFVRYLPMVKARGGTVVFGVYESLHTLLKDFPGTDETINLSVGDLPMSFDLHIPLMELPRIFDTTLETIPASIPYIFADSARAAYWRNMLSGNDFKVGIMWGGSSTHRGKHLRDCKLENFAPLAQIDGVKLYSLQKGKHIEQIEQWADKFPVINLGRQFKDFSDTAGAIENMDLVISVDTSVLHLAGAMGKPTWAALCVAGEWRWLLNRQDSPWYPTMRLFRQKRLGGWDDVFDNMARQLRVMIDKRKTPQTHILND